MKTGAHEIHSSGSELYLVLRYRVFRKTHNSFNVCYVYNFL